MKDLSPRQREILALVATGRTSKEVAAELGISESTVNWHISNVFARLGASSRAEAVALAMRGDEDRARDGERRSDERANGAAPKATPALRWVALAIALTLVLGLLGGALIAGWGPVPVI